MTTFYTYPELTPSVSPADRYGTPYEATLNQLAENLPQVSDDGSGHKFVDFSLDITTLPNGNGGIIDSVLCRKSSQTQFAEIVNPNGDHPTGTVAVCHGWWQNKGSTFEIKVKWHKVGYVCTQIPWK